MRIVLLQDVPEIGKSGELVEVKDGFARNYLIPKSLAAVPSDPRAKTILSERNNKKKEEIVKRKDRNEAFHDLDGKEIIFKVKVNRKNIPYKAVSKTEIAKKIGIDPKLIENGPTKDLGKHVLSLKMGDTVAKITVSIEAEK